MPFSIDYDGPAPIDSFLVLRPATSNSTDITTAESSSQSFTSAFRGRTIQSTPLTLPSGYKASVVTISQVAPTPSTSQLNSNKVDVKVEEEEREREKKRQRVTKPPARQQKFSMDSDDDEEGSDDNADGSVSPEPEQPEQPTEPIQPEQPLAASNAEERGTRIRIAPIAEVKGDELTVWGPDGPIDKGDDTFFRTVGEWYSVVAPLVSASSARSAFMALSEPHKLFVMDPQLTHCVPFSFSSLCGPQLHA